MKNRDWERLEKEGIQVAEFFPALLGQLQLRVNYRNHRKIVVIDGRVGFVGGFNVGREYLGRDKKFGYWRDTHLCIEGAAVTSLAVRFVLDWNYAAKENLFLEDSLFEIPQYTRNGRDPVQIISSGPDSKTKMIHDNYLRLIHRAQDHVYIQTPYFIPDDSILDALKIAAKSGVDVRIMIPCKPDHPFVYWATYSYIGEMVAAGAKCYVYNNGFLHAKTLSIDGMVACVGTANMDFRSFGLNFEVNAVIYSERTVQRLERAFENDMTLCTQVTRKVYDERGLVIKAKEQFSRLLSPLL
jgi:cardiolipin synthetase